MAKKKDFTEIDKNRFSGTFGTEEPEKKEEPTLRKYTRLNPTKPETVPKEYKFTARMPGEYGRFLSEYAYQRRISITQLIQEIVAAEMERHPEILANLDELND